MFRIEINTENAAFEDDCTGEIARILRDAAEKIEGGEMDGELMDGSLSMPLRDYNGNHVGNATADAEDVQEVED